MSIVTRFPPSPTGFMHVGNARTALFNYLFARRHGGKFFVRIEDTDRKRHSEEAVQAIFDGLAWMGLDYDGEALSQFARMDRHAAVALEMLKAGKAYYCYCSPEELEAMREKAKAEGHSQFYDRRWRDGTASDAPKDIKPVVRIKAPLEGATTINDVVQGPVTVAHDQLDDFILLRSDGTPTYMLSVVVDDALHLCGDWPELGAGCGGGVFDTGRLKRSRLADKPLEDHARHNRHMGFDAGRGVGDGADGRRVWGRPATGRLHAIFAGADGDDCSRHCRPAVG